MKTDVLHKMLIFTIRLEYAQSRLLWFHNREFKNTKSPVFVIKKCGLDVGSNRRNKAELSDSSGPVSMLFKIALYIVFS